MTDILLITFIFLVTGVVAVPLATKFGLGSVLGYLLAGVAIAPLLVALKVNIEAIQHVAEFGVVMMLFLVGLELEPKQLWNMRKRLIGLGGGQVVACSAVIMGLAMLFGQKWNTALAIGLIFSLSSTAIVLQTLAEKGWLKSDGGQASFAILLTQDIAVIPILILLPALAIPELVQTVQHTATEADHQGLSLVSHLNGWQTALATLGAVVLVVLGGNFLTTPVFRFVGTARLQELFTASGLMFLVAIALLMSLVNLSPALGTFLAGVVLANSRFKHELESTIEPIKGLLMGLFFTTIGASINFTLLKDSFFTILGLTLALMVIKFCAIYVLAMIFKITTTDRWLLALSLAQAGEFAFVLLSFSVLNAVIPKAVADQLLLVVALSMLLSPALFIFYERVVYRRCFVKPDHEHKVADIPGEAKIIIAGSGRVGGIVDRILRISGFNTTVIDFSLERLNALEKFRVNTYFGDATRPDLLHAAGIAQADLLVIAIDDKAQISKLVQYAVQNFPHLHVIARAVDRHHVYDLWAYGCRDIIRETYDGSLRMGRSALEALGVDKDLAEQAKDLFNEHDRNTMLAAANAYQVGVPAHENEAYVRTINEIVDSQGEEVALKIRALLQQGRDKAL